MLGNMQLIQAQGFGQSLLSEGLFGQHGREAVGAFLALGVGTAERTAESDATLPEVAR
jgi:hypothetical protein